MRLTSALFSVFASTLLASQAHAYLISFNILDHDFTIGSGYSAYYNYNGANADTITMSAAPAGLSYSYLEEMAAYGSGLGMGTYPIYNANKYGGATTLQLSYDQHQALAIDGVSGVNLNGSSGKLVIVGYIDDNPATPMTIVEMDFNNTSLWAKTNNRSATLAATGTVKTFFGQDVSALHLVAGIQSDGFVFNAKTPNTLFASDTYDPLAPTNQPAVVGFVSGEAGMSDPLPDPVPEPATVGVLGLGVVGLLARRGRK